jgi:hypothetical protein
MRDAPQGLSTDAPRRLTRAPHGRRGPLNGKGRTPRGKRSGPIGKRFSDQPGAVKTLRLSVG